MPTLPALFFSHHIHISSYFYDQQTGHPLYLNITFNKIGYSTLSTLTSIIRLPSTSNSIYLLVSPLRFYLFYPLLPSFLKFIYLSIFLASLTQHSLLRTPSNQVPIFKHNQNYNYRLITDTAMFMC